jgi:WhiB family redox-sensing transcriptional regulator
MTYEFLTDPDRACNDVDPEVFFPPPYGEERMQMLTIARAICGRCPFTAECLRYALDIDDRFGVYAGTTAAERAHGQGKRLRRPAPSKKAVALRRAKVMAMTDAGAGTAEIAEALGVTQHVVVADRRRANQPLKDDGQAELYERIDELDAARVGASRIALELSINRSTVYRRRMMRAAETAVREQVAA